VEDRLPDPSFAGGGASLTTQLAAGTSTGTDVSLKEHYGALRAADRELFTKLREADLRFDYERDRRYTEVAKGREEALRIKDEGDKEALRLAREIQVYKDEKANELRAQIERERGDYIGRAEFKPIADYVTAQNGTRAITPAQLMALLIAASTIIAIYLAVHG
jgi:hypothetical protein